MTRIHTDDPPELFPVAGPVCAASCASSDSVVDVTAWLPSGRRPLVPREMTTEHGTVVDVVDVVVLADG
jgi:hypothetical protein